MAAESHKKIEEELSEKLKTLKIENDINILLLGESGVGKSTFINAIANYCKFRTFKKASDGELSILLPTRFKMFDSRTGCDHEIRAGEDIDNNETLDAGASATQNVKAYVFPILSNSAKLRLIDTPGIVDTRGIDQDKQNMEAILDYIGNLHELHAICLIFKTNHTRNTAPFIYAINEILSRLEKSATNNLVFAFTNARGQDYNPGSTLECLQDIFSKIEQSANKSIKIPLKDNIFCFDNEAFRYLAAVQFAKMEFPISIKESNIESWNRSYESFYKMIKYITQSLKPHYVKNTEAVNTARKIILQMTKPLADISQLINDNIYVLERHQQNLSIEYGDINELKKQLYMPVIDLKVTDLPHPVTVCTTRKCCDIKKVGGMDKQHFREPCHKHCYLTNVQKQLIGDDGLKGCAAMDPATGMCKRCTCSYTEHMHVYYYTEVVEAHQVDENVNKNIVSKEEAVKKQRNLIAQLQKKVTELKEEHTIIIKSTAKFQHYLKTNAITTINDTYKQYIEYLLERENYMGQYRNEHVVKHLNGLLKEYEEFRKLLIENDKIAEQMKEQKPITAKGIEAEKQILFGLKYNGAKLRQLFNAQKRSIKAEHNDTVVTTAILGSAAEPDENNETVEQEDTGSGSDSDNSQSTVNSENNTRRNNRRRGRRQDGRGNFNNNRGNRGNFSNRGNRGGRKFGGKDAPPPYQDHFRHAKCPNDGNMQNQTQSGPGNYPNQGQYSNYSGPNPNFPQNNPNQFNQGGFGPNQGYPNNQFHNNQGFFPNQGGFPNNQGQNQGGFFNNQGPNNAYGAQSPPAGNPNNYKVEVIFAGPGNPPQTNYNQQQSGWTGPHTNYGPSSSFVPGSHNYGPSNYAPNTNNVPNNYGPGNYGASNNAYGPSTSSGGPYYGNQGQGGYQNRGGNDNYRGGGNGRGGVRKQYNKNKPDNKRSNQNQGEKERQQQNNKNKKGDANKSVNDNKKGQGNDFKKGPGDGNKKAPGNNTKKAAGNNNDNKGQNKTGNAKNPQSKPNNPGCNPGNRDPKPNSKKDGDGDLGKQVLNEVRQSCRAQ